MTNAAGVAAGRTHAEHRLPFDQDNITNPELSEVISGTDSHAPAADDYYVRCSFHGGDSLHEIPASGEERRSKHAFRVPTLVGQCFVNKPFGSARHCPT